MNRDDRSDRAALDEPASPGAGAAPETKSVLRLVTCGSVGDGKSTLVGLLVEGLAAEREQSTTIDVAYRFFTTDTRKFSVADASGDAQYTRNMISAASTADVAVVVIDATKGVLTQTRQHSLLVSLIGIRKVVLAINKMDLVGYSQEVFRDIEGKYREFAQGSRSR